MNYLYYPGCSLEGTALEYNISTKRFLQEVDVNLTELDDWTCCGATAAESVSPLLSLALPARNIALAEKMDKDKDILVPCSACYLNLKKVEVKTKGNPEIINKLNEVLKENQLKLTGKVHVRHLLDVLSKDLGPRFIKDRLKRSFAGFTIAPYYGCQCLRPYPVFDDPESPSSMEPLISATGASIHSWRMGGKCCGASHMNTKMEVALELTGAILKEAQGADAIVTVCPMCQMNLEAYQDKISRMNQQDLRITVLYLPQLLGLAIGLTEDDLRMDLNLALTHVFREKLKNTGTRMTGESL
ncbi:MAG: CoB--CoM heterodisulfide reductase iron-sulfur subunit B family protein [Deltaproteobacteria bacterium]|nr:CoB--CoM heterodisulfide reductase iron-sulfur subunit B family protein [Deltaproteobacteria bacterium]